MVTGLAQQAMNCLLQGAAITALACDLPAQEDWAIERVEAGAKWTWSATRPSAIIGYSLVISLPRHPHVQLHATSCIEASRCSATLQRPRPYPQLSQQAYERNLMLTLYRGT